MTTVNYETGEIVEAGTALAPLDKTAASVVTVLENAKAWLSTAVEMTGPEEIAAAKAHIRTAETYARELHLSKDIQLDAVEMVRRAEYALGKAIRKGQEEGVIRKTGEITVSHDRWNGVGRQTTNSTKSSPSDFAPRHELAGVRGGDGIYGMSDGVEPDDFEAALSEAKAEGNLSRANVVRKVQRKSGPTTRDQRAALIEELAAQGYSSRQMPSKVGVSEESVRDIARDYGIEIPADKTMRGTRRINSTAIAGQTVTALEGLVMGVELIDYDDLDLREADQWAASLDDSLKKLRRFANQIRKATQ